MPAKTEIKEDTEIAAFRVPRDLRAKARVKEKREDLTFSQLMRRALRRELEGAGK